MKNLESPRRFLGKLALSLICVVALSLALLPGSRATAASADSAISCQITYTIGTQWLWGPSQPGAGGFSTTLTIKNTGTTVINSWSVQFTFPDGQRIFQGFGANFSTSGAQVTVTNLSFNGMINPGSTAIYNPGFNANWYGVNNAPASMTLNGTTCTLIVVRAS